MFGLLGMVFSGVLEQVQRYAPWFTIVFGVLVFAIGVYLLTGRELVLSLPKLERGGADGTLPSMYLFGVSYTIASLSCAIAPFLVVTSSASNADNFASRVLTFVLYGVGMGLVITVLTVAIALARAGVVARFRELLPVMNRIAGGLMVVTGAYVAYYGYYELRLLNYGGSEDDPVIDAGLRIQTRLAELMPNTGNYGWYVVGALVLIAAAVAWALHCAGVLRGRDQTLTRRCRASRTRRPFRPVDGRVARAVPGRAPTLVSGVLGGPSPAGRRPAR